MKHHLIQTSCNFLVVLVLFSMFVTHKTVYAQDLILLKNGNQLECKSYKLKKEALIVKPLQGDKSQINVEEVDRLINTSKNRVEYIRPLIDSWTDSLKNRLVYKVIAGNVNLLAYERLVLKSNTRMNNMEDYSATYVMDADFYIERNDSILLVFSSNTLFRKKPAIKNLKSFMGDDIKALETLESNFNYTLKKVKKLIVEYNLPRFSASETEQGLPNGKVIIFRGKFVKLKEMPSVLLNGGNPLQLDKMSKLELDIPMGQPFLLSVANGDETYSEIIQATPHTNYYELVIKKGQLEFKKVKEEDAHYIFYQMDRKSKK